MAIYKATVAASMNDHDYLEVNAAVQFSFFFFPPITWLYSLQFSDIFRTKYPININSSLKEIHIFQYLVPPHFL